MKKTFAMLSAITLILLSGCSATELKDKPDELMKLYLLHDNEQYNSYLNMKDAHEENVDADGYYMDDEIAQSELASHPGMIHVSFASNSLLSVTYYTDADHKGVIDKKNCFVNPGDTIYAKVDSTSLVQSNTYEFKGFTMAVFDGDQANFNYASFSDDAITIPSDLQYKEISIIPDGAYKSRELSFEAEYRDIDGNTISLSPVWTVNVGEQSYSTKADSYSVEANAVFRVKAQYDPDEYYLIENECEPKCESHDDETGIVTFTQYDAQSAVDSYKLALGKKFGIQIDSVSATGPVTIWIDGKKYDPEFPLTAYAKLGAEVRIESTGTITGVGTTKNLIRLTNNGYVYSVYNESDAFEFDPSAYTYTNGKVIFYDSDHNEITKATSLNIGDVIYYVGKPNDGYTFNMGDSEKKLNVDSNIEYMLKNELKFTQKQKIDLPQPDKGGKITYYLNGKEVKEDKSFFAAGTDKLTASFKPAERYKVNNLSDQAECIVSTSDHRIKFKDNDGNEVAIDKVFELSSTQKADLTVELDDTVGTEIKFNIYNGTSEPINEKKSYVAKDFFDSWGNPLGLDDNQLLKDKKVETVSGLKIAVSDWSPLKNEAIRIDVTKTNASKKKTTEIYYILTGSGSQSISTDSGDSTYYTDIEVMISKVNGSSFNAQDYTYENGTVVISYDDTTNKAALKSGDFVDNSRKLKITLTANENYQVYQKTINPFSKNYDPVSSYETTCKYNKLDEEFSDMKSKTKISY